MNFLDVGPLEFIAIIVVALLVFGPNKLPEVLGQAGRWIRKARTMADDVTREFTRELNLADDSKPQYNYTPPIAPPPPYVPPDAVMPVDPPTPVAAGPVAGPISFIAGYSAAETPALIEAMDPAPMASTDSAPVASDPAPVASEPTPVEGPVGFVSGYQPADYSNGTNGSHSSSADVSDESRAI